MQTRHSEQNNGKHWKHHRFKERSERYVTGVPEREGSCI